MIRHTSSFFISIIIHSILLVILLFAWNNYSVVRKIECEKKVCLQLCDVVSSAEAINPKPKKIKKQNPTPKPTPEIIEKPKKNPETIVKKVEIKEDVIPPKEEPETKLSKKPEVEQIPQKLAVINDDIVEKEIVEEETKEKVEENKKLKQEALVKEYIEINTQKIAQLLRAHLYYPRSARKRNITGKIIVKFTLGRDSMVYDIKIIESKSDILSRAAIKTINDLSGKFPKPQKELTLHVPIEYSLK